MKYSTPLTYFKSEWTNEWRKSSFHAITITTSTIFWTNISNILNNFLFQEWNISATHDALLHWNPKGKLEVDYNILFEIRQHLIPAFLQNSFAGNEWCFVWRVQDILDDLPKLFHRTTQENMIVERQLWTCSSPRCLISHFPSTKDYILIAFLSNDTRQFDWRTTVLNFIEPKMFDRSLSYDKRLHFDRFPSNDTRQCDCRTTVVNFIELNMFDRSLSYDKRLHFDRFPSNDTRQYYCRTTVVNSFEPKMFDRSLSYDKRLHFDHFPSRHTRQCDWRTTVVNLFVPKMFDLSLSFNKRLYFDRFSFARHKIVRAQNVWSLTFLQQKTIFWSLFFRTTQDCSSPKCVISHFPSTKDYILIAFLSNDERQFDCRTTVVNFIEPKMFDRSLSYDKKLHFDRFPSNDTRQCDCRTTVVNFIELNMFDRSLSYDKRLHFDRSLSYDKRLHFDRFPSNETRQYYIRTTVVNSVEPKVFDLSLSYSKRLHFDRFPFERHKTIWL